MIFLLNGANFAYKPFVAPDFTFEENDEAGDHLQVTLMRIDVGEDIGLKRHPHGAVHTVKAIAMAAESEHGNS